MINRRLLLFTGGAALPGVPLAPTIAARKRTRQLKPGPRWRWRTVTKTFASNQPFAIPDLAPATPYPATIKVGGLRRGRIKKVTVSLTGFTHQSPYGVGVLLVAPDGRVVLLMWANAGIVGVTGINLTFDHAARASLTDDLSDPLVSGNFQPTNFVGIVDFFPPPAPTGITATTLAGFRFGGNPNGTWSLYVMDASITGTGSIASWSLRITARIRVKRKPKRKKSR